MTSLATLRTDVAAFDAAAKNAQGDLSKKAGLVARSEALCSRITTELDNPSSPELIELARKACEVSDFIQSSAFNVAPPSPSLGKRAVNFVKAHPILVTGALLAASYVGYQMVQHGPRAVGQYVMDQGQSLYDNLRGRGQSRLEDAPVMGQCASPIQVGNQTSTATAGDIVYYRFNKGLEDAGNFLQTNFDAAKASLSAKYAAVVSYFNQPSTKDQLATCSASLTAAQDQVTRLSPFEAEVARLKPFEGRATACANSLKNATKVKTKLETFIAALNPKSQKTLIDNLKALLN